MTEPLPPCPIPVMGMLLSYGFFCRLCEERNFSVWELETHFRSIHHCRPPRLSYGFVVKGESVTLVSEE